MPKKIYWELFVAEDGKTFVAEFGSYDFADVTDELEVYQDSDEGRNLYRIESSFE